MSAARRHRPVYSTEGGRLCPRCGAASAACACESKRTPQDAGTAGPVRVRREVKGRRGKTVTTIHGLPPDPVALRDLCRSLKRACGGGGAVKDGTIVLQGDHVEPVLRELERRGFRAKRAGG